MLERDVIVRLHLIVERLNNVLERNLISEYKKQHINISSHKKAIVKLLAIQPTLDHLASARTAKDWLSRAKKHSHEEFAVEDYLRAATIVYDILCQLSSGDNPRVLCGVRISPDLRAALNQAIEAHPLWEGAQKIYKFVTTDTPVYSWSYEDLGDSNGNMVFELVKSEDRFVELLLSNYSEITGGNLGGIRIAYKRECVRVMLPYEKKARENALRKAVGNDKFEKYYKTSMEILYPSTIYTNTYQIYVPEK